MKAQTCPPLRGSRLCRMPSGVEVSASGVGRAEALRYRVGSRLPFSTTALGVEAEQWRGVSPRGATLGGCE